MHPKDILYIGNLALFLFAAVSVQTLVSLSVLQLIFESALLFFVCLDVLVSNPLCVIKSGFLSDRLLISLSHVP